MGSLKRKMQRNKSLKKLKEAKKNLKKSLAAVSGLPTVCTGCNKDFDPHADADTWMVLSKDQTLNLLCPSCYERVKTAEL